MTTILMNIAEITLSMSAVILLLLLLLRLFGGKFTARCRYILWCVVLLRLAIPVGAVLLPALVEVPVPAVRGEETETAEPETEPLTDAGTLPGVMPETADVPDRPDISASLPAETDDAAPVMPAVPDVSGTAASLPAETTTAPALSTALPPETAALPAQTERPPLTAGQFLTGAAVVYLAGAAAVLVWNLIAYTSYTASVLRTARPADERSCAVYAQICRAKKMRRTPALLISPKVQSPAAFGYFRVRIVLPDVPLSGDALAGMLLHEATHCCRGDLWIKLLALWVRSVHWMNPLVYLAVRRCEEEMELSCDEAVLAGCSEDARIRYGDVMLDIVRRCRGRRDTLTTHFNPKKNAVKNRLKNIRCGSGRRRGTVLIALCLAVCLLAGTIVSCRDTEISDADVSDTADTSGTEDPAEETTAASAVDFELPEKFREIPMIWSTADPAGEIAGVRELSPEEITGFADKKYPDAAPLTVDGRTIFVFTTATGYAAAWAEGEYAIGEMPQGTLWCFAEIDLDSVTDPAFLLLSPCREALAGNGFTFGWGWTIPGASYYYFDGSGELRLLDHTRSLTAVEEDVDGDGEAELVMMPTAYTDVTVWDYADGQYRSAAIRALAAEYAEYVTYRTESADFALAYYKNGEPGTFYRTAKIAGDTLYIWDEPAEWKMLAQDAGGNVFLFGQANNTQSMQSVFHVNLNRTAVTLTLENEAWVSGTWAPQVYAGDVTGDGTADAVLIFTTGTGTGVHIEQLLVVDGISGAVYEPTAPGEAVESRVTVTQSGNKAIAADDGTLTAIYDDSYFDMYYSFALSEDGTITAETAVGYNVLQYMDDPYIVQYEFADGAFAVTSVTKKTEAQDSGKLLIGTYGVPISVYGRDDLTIGMADVTLIYNEILHDTRYEYFADSIGPAEIKVIRCDDPDVTEEEIFNWFYDGYAQVYTIREKETYSTDAGYRFRTIRYFHGMSAREIENYGAAADGDYRARREYMYMIEIDANTWLCLDYRRDGMAPVENEADYFNRTAARVEVPEIRYSSAKYADYLQESVLKWLELQNASVRAGENSLMLSSEDKAYQPYLDILQMDKWTVRTEDEEIPLITSEFFLNVGGYGICASAEDSVMGIVAPGKTGDGICVYYDVPAKTAQRAAQLVSDTIAAQQAAYQARVDAMDAFMPGGATERLVRHKIFCSEDYILSFRTEDGSLSLWRADDIGNTYVPLELEIPEEYTYDYYEVVGASGGGGSGEYFLYVALYKDDAVEYTAAYGWFREAPVIQTERAGLTADFLLYYCGESAVFPNKTVPRAIDDLSEWDVLGVEATTAYYGVAEDIRLAFLRAFLANDTARLEEICGVEKGMYDSWKGMHFGDWVVYAEYNETLKRDQVYISFILSHTESAAFPGDRYSHILLVEESIFGAVVTRGEYLYADTWHPYSREAAVLRTMLNIITVPEFPTTDDMDEGVRWQITEYICAQLGEGLHPVQDVTAYAQSLFGIENFTPDPLHVNYAANRKTAEMGEGDYCSTVPHGGSSVAYYIDLCRTDGDTTTVTVQFYADPSCTVKSCRVEYRFTKTEDAAAPYRITYTVPERGSWPTHVFSV